MLSGKKQPGRGAGRGAGGNHTHLVIRSKGRAPVSRPASIQMSPVLDLAADTDGFGDRAGL